MPATKKIPEIMKMHHYHLEGILNRFVKSRNEVEVYPKVFNKFKWELEKHFFIEEKAIFTLIYSADQETNDMKDELLKEHRTILKNLKEIEGCLQDNIDTDLTGLKTLLIEHRDFEDESFYPKLEEELDEERKKEIRDRISNPV
jgi:iron-sulfur cluster repair protein YtfE (RIC family)